jgi:hypothetical protein
MSPRLTDESINPLTMELLAWVSSRPRTYAETIEAWRSNCPRDPVWDDALVAGLVQTNGSEVGLTARGRALLDGR